MKTYYEWLIKQTYRRDPVGDLARDIEADKENLPDHKTKNSLLNHLIVNDVEDEGIVAFHESWREYKEFRSKL